jgi:membrane protease YdiL (CAAX protease family)
MLRHLKGHLLLFQARHPPAWGSRAGLRLLLIVLLLEGILGPRLALPGLLGIPAPPAWLRVPLLLGLALALVRFFAGMRLSQIGLVPWRLWSVTERSYFVQVLVLANVVFGVLFAGRLRAVLGDRTLWGGACLVALVHLAWGFHQELVYRGILQSELVRRWGTLAGILASNLLFTLGPLHFYHLSRGSPARALPMLGGIFAIGLFFALLYRRSGNLWIVGLFHGIGDAWIGGVTTLR